MSLFGGGASKPGLSINTGTANLFGSTATSQPAAAGGLFGGSASATTKPAATSLFGAAPAASSSSTAGTLFGAGTANATTGASSLFGNTTTTSAPSAAGALFGGAAATAKPATGGLFGASTTTTSAPATGGLFGGATAGQTAAPAAGGGLFGANTGAAAGSGTSLFGAPKPAATGLFGNPTTTTAATGGSGLFGATTSNTTGGLFGNPTTNTGSLFGQTAPQAAAAAAPQSSNLFGTTTQNPPTTLFGAPNASNTLGLGQTARPGINQPQPAAPQQTQRSIFNSSIGSFTAATATVPGVRIDASNLRPTTRFADLHEALQQELERLDLLILQQQVRAEECQQAQGPVRDALAYVPGDADFCAAKLEALQSALAADATAIDALKRATRSCADDAKVSFRNISALRAPSAYGGAGVVNLSGSTANGTADATPAHAQGIPAPVPAGLLDGGADDGDDGALSSSVRGGRDLANYMNRQVADMDKKLARFRAGLGEVESYLSSVEAGTVARAQSAQLRTAEGGRGRRSADDQVRELAAVLRDMEGGILAVATKVGQAREMAQQVVIDESRLRGRLGGLY